MLESKIQVEIVKYLIPLRRQGLLEFFSVPNEAAGNPVRQGQMIAMGLRPGVSDIVLLFPGRRVAFMEVKNEAGKQRDAQERFQQMCVSFGFPYRIVRSVSEARAYVESLLGEWNE